jgi:hypothetical protein
VEHYVSIKENIIENINKAKEAYDIPFISLSLDLIQNEVQNKKMIGVRVSYVHDKELISYNIAVRGFNPTREEYDAKPASELLMDWCKLILREFKIDAEKHVLTSCTDSGSDVKKALEKVFPTMREWCISHLTHLALADAFGSHVDPNKTKNSDMREFIGRCRKVIEKVNKSKTLKITLERKLLTDFGHNMKLRNSPSHRWSATEDVFVRLLKCWAQIRNAFVKEGIHFPLGNEWTLLLELRSVIHPLRFIQTMAQKTKELAVFQVYILLMEAYFGVLDDTKPLPIYDPTTAFHLLETPQEPEKVNPLDNLRATYVKPVQDLDARTTNVRKKLRAAMAQRYYNRYHPKAAYKGRVPRHQIQRKDLVFSYLIDLQAMFHPALSNARLLHRMIFSFDDVQREDKERHYSALKSYLWQTITGLAERVAFHNISADVDGDIGDNSDNVIQPQTKRQRIEDPTLALLETLISPAAMTVRRADATLTPSEIARKEVEHYLNIPKENWPKFEDTVVWWQSRYAKENMPCLSQVAGALLACKPSSGGLECDFGLLKDVIKAKRAALGQGYVEVEMMLKLNKHLFLSSPEDVTCLPESKWQEYIPKRPSEDSESDDDDDDSVSRNGDNQNADIISDIQDSSSDEERELLKTTTGEDDDLDTLLGGFNADEYGNIVEPTQETVTDSQLSTTRVFDPDETQIPGRLE